MDQSNSACDAYSPEFLAAVERVLAEEGGYSSDPGDPGGATKFGISARAHPGVDIATLTRDAAVNIYAAIAAKTFDLAVNIGAAHAIECLQRALRACGLPVLEDGLLGSATVLASSRAQPAALMAAMRSEAAGYYRMLAANRNGGIDFIKGWLNRAYA